MKKISALGLLLLTACVTINIYFPAAAAEKVADEIIKDIQSVTPPQPEPEKTVPQPESSLPDWQANFFQWLDTAVNVVISPAQAEADLAIDSAEIRQLRTAMESRFPALQPLYNGGLIGIQADGLLAVRDPSNVPLQDRNKVNKLVAAENADRQKLYQAIANANGHPEWAAQIKATFAARWISNARPGWWYQSGGNWKQK
jgi:uncharacterized protein YdbL (DUF1318 family)